MPAGYRNSNQAAFDRCSRKCGCTDHTGHDPQNEILRKLTWLYAGIGVVLLAAVFVLARSSYGAKLSLMGIQPSEAIKITFVFFMAALLSGDTGFRTVAEATVVAGLHVGILVLSRDLGSAVIFVAYLVMVYVATEAAGISCSWNGREV